MLKEEIREKPRKTIARFQNCLNLEIWDKIELIPSFDLNDLVPYCVMIEQQLKRRYISREDYPNTSYSRREPKREG